MYSWGMGGEGDITNLRFPHKDGFIIPLNKEKLQRTYTVDTRYNDCPL